MVKEEWLCVGFSDEFILDGYGVVVWEMWESKEF